MTVTTRSGQRWAKPLRNDARKGRERAHQKADERHDDHVAEHHQEPDDLAPARVGHDEFRLAGREARAGDGRKGLELGAWTIQAGQAEGDRPRLGHENRQAHDDQNEHDERNGHEPHATPSRIGPQVG
jgi:hypothetical protein